MFEWDEDKRLATLTKHGIDFIDVVEIFALEHLRVPARSTNEERFIAIGEIEDTTISVIYTVRGPNFRIITARRARKNEREEYHTYLAGRREKD